MRSRALAVVLNVGSETARGQEEATLTGAYYRCTRYQTYQIELVLGWQFSKYTDYNHVFLSQGRGKDPLRRLVPFLFYFRENLLDSCANIYHLKSILFWVPPLSDRSSSVMPDSAQLFSGGLAEDFSSLFVTECIQTFTFKPQTTGKTGRKRVQGVEVDECILKRISSLVWSYPPGLSA